MNEFEDQNTRFPTDLTSRPRQPQRASIDRAPLHDSRAARIARAAAIEVLG